MSILASRPAPSLKSDIAAPMAARITTTATNITSKGISILFIFVGLNRTGAGAVSPCLLAAPQWGQNAACSEISLPQLGQNIIKTTPLGATCVIKYNNASSTGTHPRSLKVDYVESIRIGDVTQMTCSIDRDNISPNSSTGMATIVAIMTGPIYSQARCMFYRFIKKSRRGPVSRASAAACPCGP